MSKPMNLKARIRSEAPFRVAGADVHDSREDIERIIRDQGACDLLMLDFQHTPINEEALVAFCKMVKPLDVAVMLRIPHPRQAHMVGHYLDLGPAAVLVPMTEDEATVRDAVEAFYYPPLGKRSWWPRNAYGYTGGQSPEAYAKWWAENGVLALQLETVEGVANVETLCRKGVDVLMFGAADFALSLSASTDTPLGSFEEAQGGVRKAAGPRGVRVAMGTTPIGLFEGKGCPGKMAGNRSTAAWRS